MITGSTYEARALGVFSERWVDENQHNWHRMCADTSFAAPEGDAWRFVVGMQ